MNIENKVKRGSESLRTPLSVFNDQYTIHFLLLTTNYFISTILFSEVKFCPLPTADILYT